MSFGSQAMGSSWISISKNALNSLLAAEGLNTMLGVPVQGWGLGTEGVTDMSYCSERSTTLSRLNEGCGLLVDVHICAAFYVHPGDDVGFMVGQLQPTHF